VYGDQRGDRDQPLLVTLRLEQQAVLPDPAEQPAHGLRVVQLDAYDGVHRPAQPVEHGDLPDLGPDPVGDLAVQITLLERVELRLQVREQRIPPHAVNLPALGTAGHPPQRKSTQRAVTTCEPRVDPVYSGQAKAN
jgi:hypothetical protein